jgi:nitrogen fixation/metabolism regulation signal transduction histidine kinase
LLVVIVLSIVLPMIVAATDDFDTPFAVESMILLGLLTFIPAILTAVCAAIFIKSPEDR